MTRAVIISGDFRTFQYSIQTAKPILEGADIFVSLWSESHFHHQIEPDKIYSMGPISVEQVIDILQPFNLTAAAIEDHDAEYWRGKGYNANFLHRMRRGIDLLRRTGKQYESVTFMRPDLCFGNVDDLMKQINAVEVGDFVTILSNEQRVNTHKTLNDTLFAVHPSDLDRAVPTVELFQDHKHEDWHTFLRNFVVGNGLVVRNVEYCECVILRPPISTQANYSTALYNSQRWDDKYIVNLLLAHGLERAIRDWSFGAVERAILHNLKVLDEAQR